MMRAVSNPSAADLYLDLLARFLTWDVFLDGEVRNVDSPCRASGRRRGSGGAAPTTGPKSSSPPSPSGSAIHRTRPSRQGGSLAGPAYRSSNQRGHEPRGVAAARRGSPELLISSIFPTPWWRVPGRSRSPPPEPGPPAESPEVQDVHEPRAVAGPSSPPAVEASAPPISFHMATNRGSSASTRRRTSSPPAAIVAWSASTISRRSPASRP
jgi:hypothetical protein